MLVKYINAAIIGIRSAGTRAFLTVLGIAMGIFLVSTLLSVGKGAQVDVTGRITELGSEVIVINPATSDSEKSQSPVSLISSIAPPQFTLDDIETVKKVEHISAVAPVRYLGGAVRVGDNEIEPNLVAATSANYSQIRSLTFREGGFFAEDEPGAVPVVVGFALSRQLFGEDPAVGKTLTYRGKDARVVGVLDKEQTNDQGTSTTNSNMSLIGPFTLIDNPQDASLYTHILAKVDGVENVERATEAVNIELASYRKTDTFEVVSAQQLLDASQSILDVLTALISVLAVISLTMSGVGIMNMMIVSVTDRTKEIGVRKTVGATSANIFWQFLTEAVLLTVIGGIIGIAMTLAAVAAIRHFMPIAPVLTPNLIALGLALSAFVGVVFGVGPALRAARKEPIESLQTEHS